MVGAVKSGRKRERVLIERRTPAADPDGDFTNETWAALLTVWAAVKAVRGREFTAQDKTKSEVSHRFFIRYSSDSAGIAADDRLVWRSTTYDIVSIVDIDGAKREIEIGAKVIE